LGFDGEKQSLLFGVTGIIKALAVFVLAKHLFQIGKNQIFISFVIAPAIALVLAFFAPFWLSIVIIFILEGVGAARVSVLDHFANEVFSAKVRATALSFLNMGVSLVYALILLIGGPIANQGHTNLLYSLLGICLLIVGLPLAFKLNQLNQDK
jgi:MFS family permease